MTIQTIAERVETSKPEADECVVIGATLDQVRLSDEILDEMHAPTEADWADYYADRQHTYREEFDRWMDHMDRTGCGEGW